MKYWKDLIEHNYYRVESIRMQGMVLSVFAKRKLLNQIRHVKSDWIGTGYANFWGNKGTASEKSSFWVSWPRPNHRFRMFCWILKQVIRRCVNSFWNKWSFIGNYKYTSSPWYRTGPISSSTRLHSKNFLKSEFWKLFFVTRPRVSRNFKPSNFVQRFV